MRVLLFYIVSNQDVSKDVIGSVGCSTYRFGEAAARLLGKGDHWELKSELVSQQLGLIDAAVGLKNLLRQGYELI